MPQNFTAISSLPLPGISSYYFSVSFSLKFSLVSIVFLDSQKRLSVRVSSAGLSSVTVTKCFASDPDQLRSAREDIKELLRTKFCHPILVCLCICHLNVQLERCFKFDSAYLYILLEKVLYSAYLSIEVFLSDNSFGVVHPFRQQ